jgi:hypothetical protein
VVAAYSTIFRACSARTSHALGAERAAKRSWIRPQTIVGMLDDDVVRRCSIKRSSTALSGRTSASQAQAAQAAIRNTQEAVALPSLAAAHNNPALTQRRRCPCSFAAIRMPAGNCSVANVSLKPQNSRREPAPILAIQLIGNKVRGAPAPFNPSSSGSHGFVRRASKPVSNFTEV